MVGEKQNITVIDGAQGEGGGQILRSSLTLAMCLGRPVRIENIRAGRKKPGLLRQHLTCLRAAQAICDAEVTGDEMGASCVTFRPGKVQSGEYRFAIGSAGSTALVFQTLLLPLLLADGVSELHLEGGTHNGMSPSYDFIAQCFLPVLAKMGARVEVELERYGFYPAGGGAWRARVHPVESLAPLALLDTGRVLSQTAVATSARIPGHVTARELEWVQKKCLWPEASLQQRLVDSVGPGNILSLRVEMEPVTEIFEVVGEKSLSAERVAGRAIQALQQYLSAGVPVAEHLADQLILPLLLGSGGRFNTLKPSSHLLTNIDVIRVWTGVDVQVEPIAGGHWQVVVPGLA